MLVKELNIKQDMPPADVAVALMEIEIEALTNTEYGAIKVIHGYGSHGKGGDIKKLARERLAVLKKEGKIKDFVAGEQWGEKIKEKLNIVENFPDLILSTDLKNYNSGITLVFVKNASK